MASSAPTIRILGWNIENYGIGKFGTYGTLLTVFLAQVITSKKIDIAAFCELRQSFADQVGKELVKKLGSGWKHFASDGFVPGRIEEYLFVWNETNAPNVKIAGVNVAGKSTEFRWKFHDSTKNRGQIGFRRLLKDRPPMLGEFKPKNGKASVRVAMFHAPEPKDRRDPRDAARNLATVDDLRVTKTAGVLMGDFNVKKTANAGKGSYGQPAFADLITAKFEQLLDKDQPTSLRSRKRDPKKLIKPEDCVCQPYDQIFLWAGGAATHKDAKVEDLIADVTEHITDSSKNKDLYDSLLKLQQKEKSVTKLGNLAEVFSAYRNLVSDHLPVSVSITC